MTTIKIVVIFITRGPWTATPALIKVEEREQNEKNICFFKKHGIIKSMRIFKSTQ